MELKEKMSLLESKFGKYSTWNNETLFQIASNKELMGMFDSRLTDELLKEKNEKIDDKIFALDIGYRLTESNEKYRKIVEEFAMNKITEKELIYRTVKSCDEESLFDRLNTALILISGSVTSDTFEEDLLKRINEEQLIKDLNTVQEIIVKLDISSGLITLQALIELIYKIQEYYFERTEKNVLIETEEFIKKNDLVAEQLLNLMETQFDHSMCATDAYNEGVKKEEE